MTYAGSHLPQIQDQKVQELPGGTVIRPHGWCYAMQITENFRLCSIQATNSDTNISNNVKHD